MKIYRITEYNQHGRKLSCEHFATKKEVDIRMKERKPYQYGTVNIERIIKLWRLNHFYHPAKLDSAERKIIKLKKIIQNALEELKQ